ncbi:LIC_12616 family protein [Geobacillus stearothermophilus]|uniref:Phage neck terminator protein gp12-like domain-containing protein n=1 Tax=Geobacillus stearothermophilus TaxID=1422 RepID=A0A150MUN2_GEOSE|nr:hypothetical protein [Geobacillus stearothermophilus]KYD28170.1 hypothetical protein B4109_3071 [Geobacillus stearothermophilus]
MIDIIKNMIAKAYQDTGLRIIQANTTAPKPQLPYAVYNITAPYVKDRGQPNMTPQERDGELYLTYEEQYLTTISFNVYADKNETTIDNAIKLRQWFLFVGQEYLQENGIAVVNVGNIENRTTFLVDSYEYKHGFDVQLRMTEHVETKSEWFNQVEIKGV